MGKHIYTNPFNPRVCHLLALKFGLHWMGERLVVITSLFVLETTLDGTDISQYTTQFFSILHNHMDHVKAYIRSNHANALGV